MFYTCSPAAPAHEAHAHPKPRRVRGLTVDIHCHVQSTAAQALIAPHFAIEKEPSLYYATPQTRDMLASISSCSSDAVSMVGPKRF